MMSETVLFIAHYAARFFFFTSIPGILTLRASCLTLRLCLRTPLDGLFTLVLTVVVSNSCSFKFRLYVLIHTLPRVC